MAKILNWIDQFFFGVRLIFADGEELPERPGLNIIGATVADNPDENRIDVTINDATILNFSTVADLAELAALDDSGLDNGAAVWVRSKRDAFELDKNSGLDPIEGEVVTAASGGAARWHGKLLGDIKWSRQVAWYIDPAAGDDEAVGSEAAPIKTLDEFSRRIGGRPLVGTIDVHLLGAVSGDLRVAVAGGTLLRFHGKRTALYTSVDGFTTVVNDQENSAQVAGTVRDTALSANWEDLGYVNDNARIRVTSGPSTGAIAWAIKDLDNKETRVSQWVIPSSAGPVADHFDEKTVNLGDTFVVESLSSWSGSIEIDVASNSFDVQVTFEDIAFDDGGTQITVLNAAAPIAFLGCSGSFEVLGGNVVTHACRHTTFTTIDSGTLAILAGAVTGSLTCNQRGLLVVDGDTIVQGGPVAILGRALMGFAAVWDSLGDGIWVRSGGFVSCESLFYGGALVWGESNASYGWRIANSASVVYSTQPIVTGATNDALVGGTAKAYVAIPYLNPDKLSAFLEDT